MDFISNYSLLYTAQRVTLCRALTLNTFYSIRQWTHKKVTKWEMKAWTGE